MFGPNSIACSAATAAAAARNVTAHGRSMCQPPTTPKASADPPAQKARTAAAVRALRRKPASQAAEPIESACASAGPGVSLFRGISLDELSHLSGKSVDGPPP